MRRLTIDIGNTRTKLALFEGEGQMVWQGEWQGELPPAERTIASITGQEPEWLPKDTLRVSSRLRLPITLDYETPETLGSDRIAVAAGAWREKGEGVVVIDAGTCITVDYVDGNGVYRGGAILPGLRMKFEALHNFTAKLPLLYIGKDERVEATGRSTRESIVSGVVQGARYALKGYVEEIGKREERLRVVVTGGDAQAVNCGWEEDEALLMKGLDKILMNN